MPTPNITDVEKPVVGRYYMVPCVQAGDNGHHGFRVNSWVAVLGDLHEDAEIIKFVDQHFHPDFRFAPQWFIDWQTRWRDGYKQARNAVGTNIFRRVLTEKSLVSTAVRMIRRKLLRQHPTFPTVAPWRAALEAKYANAVAKCGICPHRGMPLAGAPIRNGARVCPGHGLGFDAVTGKLKPRERA